jgi:hypothetical protein
MFTKFQKIEQLIEDIKEYIIQEKQVMVVVKTRKEGDYLAFIFLQKDFAAVSCHVLRRPWQKVLIDKNYNEKKTNVILSTKWEELYR